VQATSNPLHRNTNLIINNLIIVFMTFLYRQESENYLTCIHCRLCALLSYGIRKDVCINGIESDKRDLSRNYSHLMYLPHKTQNCKTNVLYYLVQSDVPTCDLCSLFINPFSSTHVKFGIVISRH